MGSPLLVRQSMSHQVFPDETTAIGTCPWADGSLQRSADEEVPREYEKYLCCSMNSLSTLKI